MENFDLIIVGTGFASSFFLKKYLEKSAASKRILVLERGIFFPHSERMVKARHETPTNPFFRRFSGNHARYENENEEKTWVFDPNFGGSSNCWTGCTPRFMPNDFKLKSLYQVGMDWPISYEDIEPYYCEAEEIMMIGGPLVTPFPKSRPYPLPPQKLSTVDKLIQAKYGDLYISQPTARATAPTGKRPGCCTSTVCELCPVDSKFTIENTLAHLYNDPRVVVRYNSVVHSLITENDKVKGLVYRSEGKDQEVHGEVIALGANAIFNAHILLASGDGNYYTGRGLSDQRGAFAYLYFDQLDNVGGSSMITANGYMLYDGAHRKDHAACFIESFNDPIIRNEAGKWRKIAKLKFVFEDLPGDNNRVLPTADPLVPKLQYVSHDKYVDRGMNRLRSDVERIFSFLPLERIEVDSYFQKSEFHICGTTRMGLSGQDSVVDRNMIHHQYRNLFVLGSGVFPSISPSNPTLTLSALSLRAASNSF